MSLSALKNRITLFYLKQKCVKKVRLVENKDYVIASRTSIVFIIWLTDIYYRLVVCMFGMLV